MFQRDPATCGSSPAPYWTSGAVAAVEGTSYVVSKGSLLRKKYDQVLLEGYEAAVGGAPDDTQTCPGDSGGPLVVKEHGRLVVYAVDSSGNHGSKLRCHNFGAVYAMFGPAVQDLFDEVRLTR